MIDTIENSRTKFKMKLIDVIVRLNNNLDLLQRKIKGIFNRYQAVNTIFCTEEVKNVWFDK